ncbi:MAG: ABC transporter substrate-binding protein [Stellaceae bacterium]
MLPRFLFALLTLAAGLAPAHALETLKVTMPAVATYYAPYFAAIEKGYYAQEGLALKVTFAGGGAATPALLSGTIDVSTSPASALTAIMRGAPLRVVYTMAERCNYQLWSTKPDIRTLRDLKGKSVGIISRGDTYEIAMRLTLLQAGLPQDWLSYTPLGVGDTVRGAAMASGSLPAVILASNEISRLKGTSALQHGHLIIDMSKTIKWPYTGAAVSEKFIRDQPKTLLKFLRATVKGVRYVKAFRAETLALLIRKQPNALSHQFDVDYDDSVKAMTADGTVQDDVIRNDLDVRALTLNIPKDELPPIAKIYDYAPVREATEELKGWTPKP